MPAPTERARRFFGAVRSYKEGRSSGSPAVRKAARSISYQKTREMTRKPGRKGRRTRRSRRH